MRRLASILVLLGTTISFVSSCAPTLEPLPRLATQTPWIVFVTETPGEEEGDKAQPTQTARVVIVTATLGPPKPAERLPTQTPWIVVATPTAANSATKAPTGHPTSTAAVPATATEAPAETVAAAAATEAPTGTAVSATATEAPTGTAAAATATEAPTATAVSATATEAPTGTIAAATATEVPNTPSPATNTSVLPTLTPMVHEPTSTTVAASPTPTSTTAEPGGRIYLPPVLMEPTNKAQIEWDWTVVFDWVAVGELAGDEYYRLSLERPGRQDVFPHYGDWVLTKDPVFDWSGAAKEPFHPPADTGTAQAYWWVTVVRKIGEDETGRAIVEEISAQSEQREMLIHAKP